MAPPAQPYTGEHTPILEHADVNTDPISMEELEEALRKAAKNKAAGVDDIPAEAWQWLETSNLQYLLDLFKEAISSQAIPQGWQTALVVEIYKG